MNDNGHKNIRDLCEVFLLLETNEELYAFLKDLCTPNELNAFAERWRVCKLLHSGQYSYREIHSQTGASLTTIGRVARFLKEEPHQGYQTVFEKIHSQEKKS